MKIYSTHSSVPVAPLERNVERAGSATARPTQAPIADRAELSDTGRLVSDLRETARTEGPYGGIREDVVAGIKREMAEGRFGGPQDVERAIDALLMEL